MGGATKSLARMRGACVAALLCAFVVAFANAGCVKDVENLAGLRDVTDAVAEQLIKNPSPRGCPAEGKKGIATSVGTKQQVDNAYASLNILRNTYNSTLDVTVFHYGDELAEGVMGLFKSQFGNVHFVDVEPLKTALDHKCEDGEKPNGFARKALGLYHSLNSYEHVLWLDADNFLLSDPESLFESAEYKEHGSMFWPDFFQGWVSPEIYETLTWGKFKPATTADTESGQVLINTCRHQDVLEQMWTLNEHSAVTYNYMYGDKDTFRLAFALADKIDHFYQIPSAPAGAYTTMEVSAELQRLHVDAEVQAGEVLEAQYSDRCHSSSPGFLLAMMQVTPQGDPMFLHRTNAEFSLMNERQIHTEFMVAPRSPTQVRDLMWQMPSLGWAICTEATQLLMTPSVVDTIEESADKSMEDLRLHVSLGNAEGYTDMNRGVTSEIVRTMQLEVRRTGNTTNSSSPTPSASPTAPSPTPSAAPPAYKKVIAQPVALPLANAAAYTGNVKTVYETAYGVTVGFWDTTANAWKSGCSVTSAVTGRRAITVTFTAETTSESLGDTASTAATALASDISTFNTAIATAKTSLAAAQPSAGFDTMTTPAAATGASAPTVTVTTAAPTPPPTDSQVDAAGSNMPAMCTLLVALAASVLMQR